MADVSKDWAKFDAQRRQHGEETVAGVGLGAAGAFENSRRRMNRRATSADRLGNWADKDAGDTAETGMGILDQMHPEDPYRQLLGTLVSQHEQDLKNQSNMFHASAEDIRSGAKILGRNRNVALAGAAAAGTAALVEHERKKKLKKSFDITSKALEPLLASDPGFVALAKKLYGNDVTIEQIEKDLFGKSWDEYDAKRKSEHGFDIDEAAGDHWDKEIHPLVKDFPDYIKKDQRQKHIEAIKKNPKAVKQLKEWHLSGRPSRFAKMDPCVSDVHVPGFGNKKKKPMTIAPQTNKGVEEEDVEKMKFASQRQARAAFGGYIDGISPDDAKKIADKMKSKKNKHPLKRLPASKRVAKSFVDLVSKAHEAGLIDDDGNWNVEEIEKSRQYLRDHSGRFATTGTHTARNVAGLAAAGGLAAGGAALAAKSPHSAKYAGESIKFVTQHMHSADPIERHVARALLPHALKASGKALVQAGGSATASAGAVYEGTKTYTRMRDEALHRPVQKDWKDFDAKRKNRNYNASNAGGLAIGSGGAAAGISHLGLKDTEFKAKENEKRRGDALIRDAMNEPMTTDDNAVHHPSGSYLVSNDSSWAERAERLRTTGQKIEHEAKTLRRVRGGGAALAAGGAALAGAAAYDEHKRKKELASKSVTWEGDFSKVDEDKRQVFGWASVTQMDGKPVIDLQGDYIHPDEIEKAAYDYVLKSRVGGDMHSRVDEDGNLIEKNRPLHVSDLIESVIFTPEKCEAMGVSKNLAGRWWTGFQINDPDIWTQVKSGERTGFSIHGAGIRKSVEIEELDPESELIGKAYQESENMSQFIDNLATLYDVTGHDSFADLAKHLSHGINIPQINPQQSRNAGVYGSTGSAIGGVAGGVVGAKFGHPAEGAGVGAGLIGSAATAAGVISGKDSKVAVKPQRPASVEMAMPRHDSFKKSVATTNRQGGPPSSRQEMYTGYALQQATAQLAPQVAQHIQNMQQQQWQQQQMEQQQMEMMSGQASQNFAVQMGPYSNHESNATRSDLAPSQSQGQQQMAPMMNKAPSTPSTPSFS